MFCGSGRLGVDLLQLVIAPTVSYKVTERQSIGASLLLGYQRFKAEGLQAFDNAPGFPPFTGNPGHVTNRGYDSAHSAVLRVGWQAHLSDALTVGAASSSKICMSKFDNYSGLSPTAETSTSSPTTPSASPGHQATPGRSLPTMCASPTARWRPPATAAVRKRHWVRTAARASAGKTLMS